MAQVRGFNLKASALYSMLPFLSMTIGCLGGGALSDRLTRTYGLRVGRCGLASVAFFFTAVFLVLGSRVQSPQLAGVILAGGAGALYVSQSSFWSVSADIAGRSSGVFSSMVNMGAQVGGAVTASLTPWVAQRFGWTTSFAIAAALAVVGALLWMTVHPERPLMRPSGGRMMEIGCQLCCWCLSLTAPHSLQMCEHLHRMASCMASPMASS